MIVLYCLLGVLGGLFLLLLIPIRLALDFDGELSVRLRYLFLCFRLYPRKEKKKKKPEKAAGKRKRAPEKDKDSSSGLSSFGKMLKEDGPGAVIAYLSELVKLTGHRREEAAACFDGGSAGACHPGGGRGCGGHGAPFRKNLRGGVSLPVGAPVRDPHQKTAGGDYAGFYRGGTQVRFHVRLHAIPLRILAVGGWIYSAVSCLYYKRCGQGHQTIQEV